MLSTPDPELPSPGTQSVCGGSVLQVPSAPLMTDLLWASRGQLKAPWQTGRPVEGRLSKQGVLKP